MDEKDARIEVLTEQLEVIKTHLRIAAAEAFHIDPDDLMESLS